MSKKSINSISFIGCGNMGTAILTGILQQKIVNKGNVSILDADKKRVQLLKKKFGVQASQVVDKSDVIVLAVKPQQLPEVAKSLKGKLGRHQTLISILAGVTTSTLRKQFGSMVQIVRVMPNLGATVGEGLAALTSKSKKALSAAVSIFKSCGEAVVVQEKYMDLITAISGSGPAYFFLLMEFLENEGVKGGLKRKEARELAVQTALGASFLAKVSPASPEELRCMVTSKKGTTDAAVKVFRKNGFGRMVTQAVRAAKKRAKELAK